MVLQHTNTLGNTYNKIRFSNGAQRLGINKSGELITKHNWFSPSVYSFFSKIGQGLGFKSVTGNNVKAFAKATVIKYSANKEGVKSKTTFNLINQQLSFKKLSSNDLYALKMEIKAIRYYCQDQLETENGLNSKLLLNHLDFHLDNEINSRINSKSLNKYDELCHTAESLKEKVCSEQYQLQLGDVAAFITLSNNDLKNVHTSLSINHLKDVFVKIDNLTKDNPPQKLAQFKSDFTQANTNLSSMESSLPNRSTHSNSGGYYAPVGRDITKNT